MKISAKILAPNRLLTIPFSYVFVLIQIEIQKFGRNQLRWHWIFDEKLWKSGGIVGSHYVDGTMKIVCEIAIHNRLAPNVKSRSQQSTLALGYHPPNTKDLDNLFIIHFSNTNKAGTRYKIKRNIEAIYMKFMNDGKTTISFKQPPHDLLIRCDPIQLKCFLKVFKLAMEGKADAIGLSSLAVTPVPQKVMPVKKLTILAPSDYPAKGLPMSLVQLNVSPCHRVSIHRFKIVTNSSLFTPIDARQINGLRKYSIDSGILNLCNLRILNMSKNSIESIPKRLGDMPLIHLDLSENCLGKSSFAKNWSWLDGRVLRSTLQILNLSHNNVGILLALALHGSIAHCRIELMAHFHFS